VSFARAVALAGPLALLFAALGFAASVGARLLPPLSGELAGPLHGLLFALGLAAAWAATRRTEEIERRRAEYAGDPHATRLERESAHRDAERDRNAAHRALAAAPLALGFWLAYELEPGVAQWARALPATALAGYGLGAFLLLRWCSSGR
jgi:hypothetical protein